MKKTLVAIGLLACAVDCHSAPVAWRYESAGEIHFWSRTVIESAMQEWSEVCGIDFRESADGTPIRWTADIPAAAWYIGEAVEFNPIHVWSLDDLYRIARHELGHLIGIHQHDKRPDRIMSGPPFSDYAMVWVQPSDCPRKGVAK